MIIVFFFILFFSLFVSLLLLLFVSCNSKIYYSTTSCYCLNKCFVWFIKSIITLIIISNYMMSLKLFVCSFSCCPNQQLYAHDAPLFSRPLCPNEAGCGGHVLPFLLSPWLLCCHYNDPDVPHNASLHRGDFR